MVDTRLHVFDVPGVYMNPTHFGVLPRLFTDSHWSMQFETMLFPVNVLYVVYETGELFGIDENVDGVPAQSIHDLKMYFLSLSRSVYQKPFVSP
jgi:hypothetical protein